MKQPSDLQPRTLINRVMSGKKQYRTNDYLQAFAKLPSTELHDTPTVGYLEVIKLWNSLQSTPNKVRYFTFSLTHNNSITIKKIKKFYSHEKYAYILHDKDKSAEHKHYHYLLMFESPRSFKAIANDLEIPVTMLQKVYSKKGMLDYLTHENDPNKYHYSLDEITANFDVQEEKDKDEQGGSGKIHDFKKFFFDYCDLREGRITIEEFFDKYKYVLCDISCTSAFGIADRLYLAKYEGSSSGASLSSRAECRGRTSVSNSSIQTKFYNIDPNTPVWLENGSKFSVGSEPAKVQKRRDYRKGNSRSDLCDIEP